MVRLNLIHFSKGTPELSNSFHTLLLRPSYVVYIRQLHLTHWGQVTDICVSKLSIIGSDNGLSPGRCQANIWTNVGILLIQTLGTNFSEILSKIQAFSFKEMSSAKWRPFCLGLNVLKKIYNVTDITLLCKLYHADFQSCQSYWNGQFPLQCAAMFANSSLKLSTQSFPSKIAVSHQCNKMRWQFKPRHFRHCPGSYHQTYYDGKHVEIWGNLWGNSFSKDKKSYSACQSTVVYKLKLVYFDTLIAFHLMFNK